MDDMDEDHDGRERMHALREKLRVAGEARIEALAATPVPEKPRRGPESATRHRYRRQVVISLFSPPPRRIHRSQSRPSPKPAKPKPKTRPTDVDPRADLSAIEDERRRAGALRLLDIYSNVTGERRSCGGPSIIGFGNDMIGSGKKAYA